MRGAGLTFYVSLSRKMTLFLAADTCASTKDNELDHNEGKGGSAELTGN